MRYVLLIYHNEAAAALRSPQEQQALMAGHFALIGELGAQLLGGGALQPTSAATTVRLRVRRQRHGRDQADR
jgi:hypothetical protein